jgi:hypothetical protein
MELGKIVRLHGCAILLVLFAACSSDSPGTPNRVIEPSSEAGLHAAARAELDSFAAGNYGAVWDHLGEDDQKLISREDYITALEACPNVFDGVRLKVVKVTPNPDGTWNVEVDAAGSLVTIPAAYENGMWVFPFTSEARERFERGDTSC